MLLYAYHIEYHVNINITRVLNGGTGDAEGAEHSSKHSTSSDVVCQQLRKSLAVTSCCHSLAWICSPDVNVWVLGSENSCLEDNGVREAKQEPQALLPYTSEMVNHLTLKDRKKHVGATWENKHGCNQNIVSNWERGSTNQDQLWDQSSSDRLRADLSSAGRTNWCRRGTISRSSDVFSPAPQLWQKCGDTEVVVVVTDILSHVLTTSETQQWSKQSEEGHQLSSTRQSLATLKMNVKTSLNNSYLDLFSSHSCL